MQIDEIFNSLNKKLKSQIINPRILLDKLRLISEDSRKSSQYQDPNYLPFYYYLSKFIFPKNIVHIGLDLALPSCCFLQGSKTVESILCFQKKKENFYSPRLAISNIKDVKGKKFEIDYYFGNINDVEFVKKLEKNFDFFLITEKFNNDEINELLDMCWQYLSLDGFIVVDHVGEKSKKEIFSSFCKGKNRDFLKFDTRYGIGLVQK